MAAIVTHSTDSPGDCALSPRQLSRTRGSVLEQGRDTDLQSDLVFSLESVRSGYGMRTSPTPRVRRKHQSGEHVESAPVVRNSLRSDTICDTARELESPLGQNQVMTGDRLARLSLRFDAISCIVLGLVVALTAPFTAQGVALSTASGSFRAEPGRGLAASQRCGDDLASTRWVLAGSPTDPPFFRRAPVPACAGGSG